MACSKQPVTYVITTAGCDWYSGLPGIDFLYLLVGEGWTSSLKNKMRSLVWEEKTDTNGSDKSLDSTGAMRFRFLYVKVSLT